MALVRYSSFYNGPLAVYTSSSGLTDPVTLARYPGGNFNQGDFVDLTASEAALWNQQYGSNLFTGRYRIVKISPLATAANIKPGAPVAFALGTTLALVTIAAAGTGATPGNYIVSSTVSGGTSKATANVVIGTGGGIVAAQLQNPGANFTSTPTFGLTEITGLTGGSLLAQMSITESNVTSWDASAVSLTNDPKGVFLNSPTAAQILAGAWVVIQESGIASVSVTTATATAAGSTAYVSATNGVVTTNVATAYYQATLGKTIDLAAAGVLVRVDLSLPLRQG